MSPCVHLSIDERLQIYRFSQGEIACRLVRDEATISRELRRSAVSAGYLPDLAQRRCCARHQRCPGSVSKCNAMRTIALCEPLRSPVH